MDAIERVPVLLGLGANVGDPWAQLARAVEALRAVMDVRAVSSVWRTAPVGHADQPDFLNLVVRGETALSPHALLRATLRIERAMGRLRDFPNAPRTLDVDLLDHGGLVRATRRLVLPHPRMADRAFVLAPLAEAAPAWRHPVLGRTARELLDALPTPQRIARVGSLPASG